MPCNRSPVAVLLTDSGCAHGSQRRADLEALMPHLADDFVFCASVGPEPGATYVGKEAAREGFRRMFSHDADWTPIPNEIFPFEDRVMLLWGYRREVDGEPVVVRGCDIFHFRGRLIIRKDAFRKVFAVRAS